MGGHAKTPEYTEEEITVGPKANTYMKLCFALGFIGLGVSAYLGHAENDKWAQFLFSYLVAFMFVLSTIQKY